MERLVLLVLANVFILIACQQPSDIRPTVAGDTGTNHEPGLLLTSDAAASILRNFLVDCVASWDVIHKSISSMSPKFERGGPVPTGELRTGGRGLHVTSQGPVMPERLVTH
jgi:hypothetical protein